MIISSSLCCKTSRNWILINDGKCKSIFYASHWYRWWFDNILFVTTAVFPILRSKMMPYIANGNDNIRKHSLFWTCKWGLMCNWLCELEPVSLQPSDAVSSRLPLPLPSANWLTKASRPRFNVNMTSNQCRKSLCGDKTIWRCDSLYW